MTYLSDQGVVTGCDGSHQWMLPWWFFHFRKHNPNIPVGFFNFGGMTQECIKWCSTNGYYADLSDIKTKMNWFKKPFAIWHSPFKKTMWMDNDCETQKPVDGFFSFVTNEKEISATYDPFNTFCISYTHRVIKNPIATGVIVSYSNNELIGEWARKCRQANQIRGDQEVLNYILSIRKKNKEYTTKIRIMPAEYQWLRIYNQINTNAYIMHWTGPDGKKHIKKCIDDLKPENSF